MLPEKRVPTRPGEILLEEFLLPMGLTQVVLARHPGIPIRRVNEIIAGKRAIRPETAWHFSFARGTTPGFWVNAQSACDLARSRPQRSIKRLGAAG